MSCISAAEIGPCTRLMNLGNQRQGEKQGEREADEKRQKMKERCNNKKKKVKQK